MSVALIIGLPVVLGTLLLALLALRLWRQVTALGREVSAAGGRIEVATAELAAADPTRAAERRQPGWDAGYRAGLAAARERLEASR